jgi:MFS family permease
MDKQDTAPLQPLSEPASTGYFRRLQAIFQSRNFIVILLTNYTSMFFMAAFVYLNLFFRDVGISYFELGIANGWSMFVGLFGVLLGGYWADKGGGKHRKQMAAFNKFFIGIAVLIIGLATDLPGIMIAWTFFGVGQFCRAAIQPILFESIPREYMGTATSLFTLGGLCGLLGLVLVGFLIQDGFVAGLRVFWHLAAFASFIDFLIREAFLEPLSPIQGSEETELKYFFQDLIKQYRTGVKIVIATIPLFLMVFILDVISDICYSFAQTFFLNEDVGMEYISINYIMIGATFIGVIGGLFAGSLLDRSENDARVMFFAYLFLPISVFLLLYSPISPNWTNFTPEESIWTVITSTAFVAVVIKAGNDVVWRTIAFGAVGRRLPREHTGKATALLSMIISMIGIILMPIVGYIYQIEGGLPLLFAALILNIIILGALLSNWMRNSPTRLEATSVSV